MLPLPAALVRLQIRMAQLLLDRLVRSALSKMRKEDCLLGGNVGRITWGERTMLTITLDQQVGTDLLRAEQQKRSVLNVMRIHKLSGKDIRIEPSLRIGLVPAPQVCRSRSQVAVLRILPL